MAGRAPFGLVGGVVRTELATVARRVVAEVPLAQLKDRGETERPIGFGDGAARRHVLPHQHAQPVALVIKTVLFHLDVQTEQVEAQVAHGLDVRDVRLVGGRGEQAVGPVALVEYAFEQQRPVVEAESRRALHVGRHLAGAKRAVAVHDVRVAGRACVRVRARLGARVRAAKPSADVRAELGTDARSGLGTDARSGLGSDAHNVLLAYRCVKPQLDVVEVGIVRTP